MSNVFLTGFMGTGKSAVGRVLARRLGRRFVDLDEEIERSAGLAVAEIFARFGERDFRDRERRALERLSQLDGAIIATGGGAVVDPENRAVMRARGAIVCLTAQIEAILARVGGGNDRPLLADTVDRPGRIAELLAERAPAYADADLTVETTGKSPEEVGDAIERWLSATVPAGRRAGA